MPHFIPRKIHLRKSSTKSGHEVSIPPDWITYHGLKTKDKQEMELLYDSIIIISPPGTNLSKEKQKKIAKIIEEEESNTQ